MAQLKELATGRLCVLDVEHVVGRSPGCSLVLDHPCVSSRHALVRWTGGCWEVRDLASRNGTFVGQERLGPAEDRKLVRGARVSFGHDEITWEMLDDGPPVEVVPLDGGPGSEAHGDLMAVPSADEPLATIYRVVDGWRLERSDGGTERIADQQTFEVAGRRWLFRCPEAARRTLGMVPVTTLRDVRLTFAVSRDEEHVELKADVAGRVLDLGARAHNYLLLTLARQRIAEQREGHPVMTAGWTYQDDLLKALAIDASQLNIDVFRIRRQFSALGFVDAASVVERRPRTGMLRIGVPALDVVTA